MDPENEINVNNNKLFWFRDPIFQSFLVLKESKKKNSITYLYNLGHLWIFGAPLGSCLTPYTFGLPFFALEL